MKKKTPKKSANDWLAEILSERVMSGKPQSVPHGWMTIKQMMEQSPLSECRLRIRIKAMVKHGKLEERKFRIWTGHQLAMTTHYHPKK
jgi:hypothetical protein